jgi:hypothetical protein
MTIKSLSIIAIGAALTMAATSCTKDLDRVPYVQETSETVYADPVKIKGVLAKLYGSLCLSGQHYEDNSLSDIITDNTGTNVFLRNYWELQELTTDEAVIGWNDGDLLNFHSLNYTPDGKYVKVMYDRIFFGVAACNEFLRQTPDDKMSSFPAAVVADIKEYRYEARFLRALYYWVAIDLYGKVPFVTEKDPVGAFQPKQISRADLFTYLETELKDLENLLPEPLTNEYGRADKGAAWMLLAKLYLNATIYTGVNKNTETITYCNKLLTSPAYALSTDYSKLFKTDNNQTKEIIFPILADGVTSQSYGNTTFIVLASLGGTMNPADYGTSTTWGGMRTTKNLVNLFPDPFGTTDKRAMFYINGQNLDIADLSSFNDGYAVPKFKNISSTGQAGTDPAKRFTDTDFPLFRLGDAYLMYAEAVTRGGAGGSVTDAVNYVNLLRRRGYGNTNGDINASQLTLDFLLAERGRELYWEAQRRTDLVRFGKLTDGTYLWPFKGGVAGGTGVHKKYNVFPIPTTDRIANPNLVQNADY